MWRSVIQVDRYAYVHMYVYESDTGKEDLLSELKSVCQLYKQMLQDAVISEIHKIFDVLHFLEILEMSRIFQTFIEAYNNVFPASIASAERRFSRQIKRYTRSTMDEIRLSDLSVINIEREFSENFDFNSVFFTFAKMKQLA